MGPSVEVLHLSEHEAYLRIACARASRRFPVLLDMLADGRLHLSAIAKLAPHLSEDNAEVLLSRAVHLAPHAQCSNKRPSPRPANVPRVEELCAEVAPRQDVAARMRRLPRARVGPGQLGPERVPGATAGSAASSPSPARPAADARGADRPASLPARPAVLEPIAPTRYKVQFTASSELRDKLDRAKALLHHTLGEADLGEVIDEAVSMLLAKLEGRRFGKTDRPRKTLAETDTSATSRHVPAAVKRAVFERDGGQCTFVDETTGRRCSCTDPGKLEYHHTTPFALGADHDPGVLTLRCTAHNQHQAELDFGRQTMDRYRTSTSRAREPGATYPPRPRAPSPEQCLARSRQAESPKGEPAVGSPATEPGVEAPRVVDLRGAAPTARFGAAALRSLLAPGVGGAPGAACAGWGERAAGAV